MGYLRNAEGFIFLQDLLSISSDYSNVSKYGTVF